MRILTLLAVAAGLQPALSLAQVWEKPLAPGLVYRMEIDSATPRIIHGLRFSPGSPTKAVVELAGGTVYEETATKGRNLVSEIVAQRAAIAGLNADFFPYTGDPLGAMVRGGELLSVPTVPRASFGWANEQGSGAFGIVSWRGSFQSGRNEVPIDNLDGECPKNGIALNNEAAGFSLCSVPNVHVTLHIDQADWGPNGITTATVQAMNADVASVPVPKGSAILVAQGNKAGLVTSLRPGDKVQLRFESGGIDWRKVDQLVSGGPFLVKDGAITPDSQEEKFKPEFFAQRHPRSAVGKTAAGDFWFVAVDGRQPISDGATIQELAQIMFKLGCRDAINLDGGGSTDMNVMGIEINRPSDGVERPVASAILFLGEKPEKSGGPVMLDAPSTLDLSASTTVHATQDGKPVPDAEVLWSAQGAAWIDQGGLLKPLKPGVATVTAWVKGQIVSRQITVTGAPKPVRTTPVTSRSGDRGDRRKKKGGGG